MKRELAEAVRLLKAYTAGRFRLWNLAGQPKASVRAHVMAALLGVSKVPQARAGVTRLRDEFYEQAGIAGDTDEAREEAFVAWCRSVTAAKEQVS